MKLRALLALVLMVAASALLSGGATAGKACDLIPDLQAAQEAGKKPEKCPPKKKKVTLSGTVTNGNGGKPVKGAILEAGGQTKRTTAKGTYTFKLDQGDYVVRPREDPKCANEKPPASALCGTFTPRSRNVSLQEDRGGIDFKFFKRDLKVELIPKPAEVILEELDDGNHKPEKFTVEVKVTNLTSGPVTAEPPEKLDVEVKSGEATNPIHKTKGPTPKTLELAPGKPKSTKYTLEVEKLGEFELSALVLGDADGRTVRGLGTADLKADAGLQVKVQFVKRVEVPDSPGEFMDQLLDSTLAEPFDVNLEDHPDKEKTEAVPIRVTVKNTQKVTVEDIRLDDLAIEWKVEGVEEPATLPLKQSKGPEEPVIPKLEPGESDKRDYELEVSGDGTYEIVGTAKGKGTGDLKGKTIPGKGRAYLHSRTPLLFFYAKVDRTVTSPDAPKLQAAGTAFSIRIRLQNRSYTETLIVDPFRAKLSGNAFDGHIQEAGLPIQVGEKILDPEVGQNQGYVVLEPNDGKPGKGKDERELDAVIRTKASDPTVAGAPPTGGTRALVAFDKPTVRTYTPPPKGFTGPGKLTLVTDLDRIVFAEGADSHSMSVNDSVPQPPPVDFLGAVAHFTYGATIGLANSFVGAAQGLLDLPHLLIQGSYSIWQAFVERQAELWTAVISEPDLLSAYRKLQEKNAEFMTRDIKTIRGLFPKIKGAFEQANKAAEKKFTGIANNWYQGDWTKAAQDMGEIAGQTVGDLALADAAMSRALSIVPRLAKAARAVDKAKLAENKTIRVAVETFNRGKPTAARVIKFLTGKVKPGYIFAFEELADLYGLSHKQAVYLAGLCKKNKILIGVRSRASESLTWINKGAYVKPEFIKLKNVNHYDVQYLGYAEQNMGRVVIRRQIPTEVEVIAALDRNGVTDAASRKAVLQRRLDRIDELQSDKPGFAKELSGYAATGEDVPTKYNWKDNGLDPQDARSNKTTNVKYQLTPDPPGAGDLVVEVNPGGAGFNSVTGDVDLTSITYANGAPLSEADHLRLLDELRGPPMYIQHPESVTWNKDGSFDFEKKHFELSKDEPVQFGSDGNARKVRYVRKKSSFTSNKEYTVHWDGGYRYTGREGPLPPAFRIPATSPAAPSTGTQPGIISYGFGGRRYATGAGVAVFAGR